MAVSTTLNPEEINALMDAIQSGRVDPVATSPKSVPVVPYDLTSRDRIIRGQMPTLDSINEQISSVVGSALAARIRVKMRLSSAPSTLLKFGELASILAPPSTIGVLKLGMGYGLALIVLEPGVADSLLGAALGDRRKRPENAPAEARRELTAVERMVLKRLLTIFTDAMASAWARVLPFKPEIVRFETDPRMAVIAPPSETAVLCSFEFNDNLSGRIHLAIPFTAVESEKKTLSSAPKVATGVDRRFAAALGDELESVRVMVQGLLGKTSLPMSRVLDLEVGDLIMLDSDEQEPLDLAVQGRVKVTGRPAVSNANLAMVVASDIRPPMRPANGRTKQARIVTLTNPER